jgi:polyphosphate kinase 2 (PPK2 family)
MDADESSDDNEEEETVDNDMVDAMNTMDAELRQDSALSRTMDDTDDLSAEGNEKVVEDAHVLSTLLKSLDAAGGGPGSIKNILEEMEAPDPPSEETS